MAHTRRGVAAEYYSGLPVQEPIFISRRDPSTCFCIVARPGSLSLYRGTRGRNAGTGRVKRAALRACHGDEVGMEATHGLPASPGESILLRDGGAFVWRSDYSASVEAFSFRRFGRAQDDIEEGLKVVDSQLCCLCGKELFHCGFTFVILQCRP